MSPELSYLHNYLNVSQIRIHHWCSISYWTDSTRATKVPRSKLNSSVKSPAANPGMCSAFSGWGQSNQMAALWGKGLSAEWMESKFYSFYDNLQRVNEQSARTKYYNSNKFLLRNYMCQSFFSVILCLKQDNASLCLQRNCNTEGPSIESIEERVFMNFEVKKRSWKLAYVWLWLWLFMSQRKWFKCPSFVSSSM